MRIKFESFKLLDELQRRFFQTTDKIICIETLPADHEARYRVWYWSGT